MIRRPTIIDAACAAGLAKSTVSLVFQNSPAVKAETRDAAQVFPALTLVHCDIAGFAAQVAATIQSSAEAGTLPAPQTHAPVRLIVRASSGERP
jgi:DNA-binding LacI/PurR family transcriptional regulator